MYNLKFENGEEHKGLSYGEVCDTAQADFDRRQEMGEFNEDQVLVKSAINGKIFFTVEYDDDDLDKERFAEATEL